MRQAYDSWLCGWRVASDVALPDLMPWTGDNRPADLQIRVGSVPEHLPGAVQYGPLIQLGARAMCRFAVPGVATYLIENARTVTIAPDSDAGSAEVRVFLLGTVFGILCHQRGLLPLHASCVRIEDHAVAFCGPSGAGKSTLAAGFESQGYPILSDDVCVIDTAAPGGPVVWPSFPRIKLWRDAIDRFAFSTEGLERTRPTMEKYQVRTHRTFDIRPAPLAAVYYLRETREGEAEGISQMRGLTAVRDTCNSVYRRRLGRSLGSPEAMLSAVGSLCERIPILRLGRGRNFSKIPSMVKDIAGMHAGVCL
ncbi:MAG TPA: hypothetical protein VER03_15760 [Bryobacteraceae bacterium]|nr:hypothetical protein [Bryobacteraceae bacterium]